MSVITCNIFVRNEEKRKSVFNFYFFAYLMKIRNKIKFYFRSTLKSSPILDVNAFDEAMSSLLVEFATELKNLQRSKDATERSYNKTPNELMQHNSVILAILCEVLSWNVICTS